MKSLSAIGSTTLVLAACLTAPLDTTAQPAGTERPMILSGTLLKLDLDHLRGLLQTEFGKPIFFDVPKAYLFENITLGARITLQLDEYGRAQKVMDTSLPDLLPAPAGTPAAGSSPVAANAVISQPEAAGGTP